MTVSEFDSQNGDGFNVSKYTKRWFEAAQRLRTNKAYKEIREYAQVKDGDWVLDLGCGEGSLLREILSHHDVTAVGVDINPMCLSRAKKNLKKMGCNINSVGDFPAWPYYATKCNNKKLIDLEYVIDEDANANLFYASYKVGKDICKKGGSNYKALRTAQSKPFHIKRKLESYTGKFDKIFVTFPGGEVKLTLDDMMNISEQFLKPGGSFVYINRDVEDLKRMKAKGYEKSLRKKKLDYEVDVRFVEAPSIFVASLYGLQSDGSAKKVSEITTKKTFYEVVENIEKKSKPSGMFMLKFTKRY